MSFFLGVHSDEKGVKQLLRLVLSKFGRRQPGRSDNEWANMWRDMQCLQEKAFPFLDTEYVLMEFCRGLLKAGKFSLARNYLKGTSTITLATEKAENLVIQAAREYFFSASSLASTEVSTHSNVVFCFVHARDLRNSFLINFKTVTCYNDSEELYDPQPLDMHTILPPQIFTQRKHGCGETPCPSPMGQPKHLIHGNLTIRNTAMVIFPIYITEKYWMDG